MGDIADLLEEQEYIAEERDSEIRKIINNKSLWESERDKWKWITRDGMSIPISKLTDSHLCNCLQFIKRTYGVCNIWHILSLEQEYRASHSIHAQA
jgi:hypothetical protein